MVANQVEDREEEGERRQYQGLARGGIPNRWIVSCKELVQVGMGLWDPDPGKDGGDTSPGPTGESDAKSTTRDVGRQVGLNTGSTDSEPDIVVQNTQDVWSLPCPLFSSDFCL